MALLRIGHDVFTFGYVAAMRSTMMLPVILLAVGAVSCLLLGGAAATGGCPAGRRGGGERPGGLSPRFAATGPAR